MLNERQAAELTRQLLEEAGQEWNRLEVFSRYYRGHHRWPYNPRNATNEFWTLAKRSITNLTPVVVHTVVERLYVDGYRPHENDNVDSESWRWWQNNGLDSRQKKLYTTVGINGYGYMLVLPGDNGPFMRPQSARTWYAKYRSTDDEYPMYAIRKNGDDESILLDDTHRYVLQRLPGKAWEVIETAEHGLGVCPLVRFENNWDIDTEQPIGEIEPVIPVQDRLNQTIFDLLVSQTYASAPQRYIAGLQTGDTDTSDLALALANRIWTFSDSDTQVGQLPPGDVNNLVQSIDNAIRVYGQISKVPPHYLLGEIVNISGDALVAADSTLSKKIEDRKTILGEAWESTLRLAAAAAGDEAAAADRSSQVIWRETDPRSIAQVVDALGKMVDQLHVPAQEVWPMIPGVTQQDVERWKKVQEEGDPLQQFQDELRRQIEGDDA